MAKKPSEEATDPSTPATVVEVVPPEPVPGAVAPSKPDAPAMVAVVSFMADVNPTTAQALIGQMAQLANQGFTDITLLLSTPGGTVREGMAIYNILRGLPIQLTTHNVGNVDSIGNVIFLAGERRYACPNTTFMFHGVGQTLPAQTRLEQRDLREKLGSIEADNDRIARVLEERATFNDAKEVRDLFVEASTKDADYAVGRGIIHDVRNVEVPRGTPVFQLVFQR